MVKFLNSFDNGSVDRAVDQHTKKLKSVDCSVDQYCTREENLVGGRPCGQSTQLSEVNREIDLESGRPAQL